MRLFYAALFSREMLKSLGEAQGEIQELIDHSRRIHPTNFHLTLHFLGETPDNDISRLAAVLDESAAAFTSHPLKILSPGCFPRGVRNLIYAALSDPEGELRDLASRLRGGAGAGDGRPLKPHITLFRDAVFSRGGKKRLADTRFTFPPGFIRSLALMESRQQKGGVVYLPLHEIPFQVAPGGFSFL